MVPVAFILFAILSSQPFPDTLEGSNSCVTRVAAPTRAALGDDAFELAWRDGSAMALDDAVRYALGGQTGRDARAQ